MSILELYSILELGLIFGITSIGIFLTFRVIDFPDLTVDGSFVTGAAVAVVLLKAGYSPLVSVLGSMIAGCVAGLITAFINVYLKIDSLLVGIITAFMLYSINLRIMSGIPNLALTAEATIFGTGQPVYMLFVIAIIICLSLSLLFKTEWGLALRAAGLNPNLAKTYGVNVNDKTIFTLIFSNGLVGLSGGLFFHYQGFADISMGIGTVIIGLTGVILGEIIYPSKSITLKIITCMIGSIIYKLIVSYALRLDSIGLKSSDLNLITGILVVVILQIPLMKKLRGKNAAN